MKTGIGNESSRVQATKIVSNSLKNQAYVYLRLFRPAGLKVGVSVFPGIILFLCKLIRWTSVKRAIIILPHK